MLAYILCYAHPSRIRLPTIYSSTSHNPTPLHVTQSLNLYRSEWNPPLDLNWSLIKPLKLKVKDHVVRMIWWTETFVHRSGPSWTFNPPPSPWLAWSRVGSTQRYARSSHGWSSKVILPLYECYYFFYYARLMTHTSIKPELDYFWGP